MIFSGKRAEAYLLLLVGILALAMILNLIPLSKARADAVTCQLTVPANALTPDGLATPWQLQAPCHEASSLSAVFVQAMIFDPATKQFSVYNPLVIDAGSTPAITPTAPVLPANAVVGLFGGGDDDVTTLIGAATQCVNGADGKIFGQVFFCNAQNFFAAVNKAGVTLPALGLDSHGDVCPTVRSFKIVDQDQSDNVTTSYLFLPSGATAQNTAANRATLGVTSKVTNGSDNRLLDAFIDPAIGCVPAQAPDLADNNALLPTQALNELQAAQYQADPIALIPSGDPMVGPNDLAMLNAYRLNVNQTPVHVLKQANTVPYCAHLKNAALPFIESFKTEFQASASPAQGVNLYDFLTARYQASRVLLGCK